LPRYEKQIVERQVERLARCQDDGFLGRAQRRMQRVRAMGAVLYVLSFESLRRGCPRDAEDLCRLAIGQTGIPDLLPDLRGGASL